MRPEDFPIEKIDELSTTFTRRADAQIARARGAGTHDLCVGYYESAIAYQEAARQAREVALDTMHALAHLAQDQRDAEAELDDHPWPLDGLADLWETQHDGPRTVSQQQRFPRWGVLNDQFDAGEVTALSISPAVPAVGGVLVYATDGPPQGPATRQVCVQVDFEQWDQLDALVRRIRAGLAIPYDEEGNTLTPQVQEEYQR